MAEMIIPALLVGVSAASTIAQGANEAKAAAEAAEAQIKAAEFNEELIREDEQAEKSRLRRIQRRRMGAERAAIGASGFRAEGSPLELMLDNAAEMELDILNVGRTAQSQVYLERTRARTAAKAGKRAAGAALLGTGARLGSLGLSLTGPPRTTTTTTTSSAGEG